MTQVQTMTGVLMECDEPPEMQRQRGMRRRPREQKGFHAAVRAASGRGQGPAYGHDTLKIARTMRLVVGKLADVAVAGPPSEAAITIPLPASAVQSNLDDKTAELRQRRCCRDNANTQKFSLPCMTAVLSGLIRISQATLQHAFSYERKRSEGAGNSDHR